jgi:hypothetical protein
VTTVSKLVNGLHVVSVTGWGVVLLTYSLKNVSPPLDPMMFLPPSAAE